MVWPDSWWVAAIQSSNLPSSFGAFAPGAGFAAAAGAGFSGGLCAVVCAAAGAAKAKASRAMVVRMGGEIRCGVGCDKRDGRYGASLTSSSARWPASTAASAAADRLLQLGGIGHAFAIGAKCWCHQPSNQVWVDDLAVDVLVAQSIPGGKGTYTSSIPAIRSLRCYR